MFGFFVLGSFNTAPRSKLHSPTKQQAERTKNQEPGTKNRAPRDFPIACGVFSSHFLAMSLKEKHPAVALAERRLKMHIAKHLPNARVWLFGSRATGAALRRSDFDLAVQPGSGTPDTDLIDFEASVREDFEIIYPVDVVDLRRAPESLKQSIEKDGILWKN